VLRLGAPELFGEGAPDLSGLDIQRVEEEQPQLIFQWSIGGDVTPSFSNKTKHLLYVRLDVQKTHVATKMRIS
jgi:hypothetical protein